MKVRLGTILVAVATAIVCGESALAELPPNASETVTNAAAATEARTYVGRKGEPLNYRIYAPEKTEAGRRYPLVLFLHGAGSRGDDNARQLHWGWPIVLYMKAKGLGAYLIAPQCPKGKQWVDTPWGLLAHKMPDCSSEPMSLVIELLEKTIRDMPVDASRVYVTGLSMGGYGTWDIVQRRPELFAAAIPVCGGGDSSLAWKIRSVPIWTFHGDKDDEVPVARSRQMVSALWQCDGNIRYREYPGVGHGCWIPTYNDHTVLDWLFAQKLQSPVKAARRMVGETVMTEHHCRGSRVSRRPVAMAAYGIDSHHVRRVVKADGFVRNEGNVEAGRSAAVLPCPELEETRFGRSERLKGGGES